MHSIASAMMIFSQLTRAGRLYAFVAVFSLCPFNPQQGEEEKSRKYAFANLYNLQQIGAIDLNFAEINHGMGFFLSFFIDFYTKPMHDLPRS